jgi:lipooligosaccharide transport system permease protein
MLATPLRVRDVVLGHQAFFAFRLLLTAIVYFIVITAFGAVSSPLGVLAIPVTVLVGLSFSTSIAAWAAHTQTEVSFIAIFRFLILPMFLFSGTFFPISTLPTPLEVIAWLTPLWHGVTLCRDLTLGDISVGHDLMHLCYLLACVTAGLLLARMTYGKRLVV